MARTYIKIEGTSSHANLLRAFVQQQRLAYETGAKIRAIMSNSNDGEVFTDVETLLGLPSGKGQAVYDLVNGTIGALEGTFQNNNGKTLGESLG